MEIVMLVMLALAAIGSSLAVRRHQQAVAWERELEIAFGAGPSPEMPRHRFL